jgi:hypothetical protein
LNTLSEQNEFGIPETKLKNFYDEKGDPQKEIAVANLFELLESNETVKHQ